MNLDVKGSVFGAETTHTELVSVKSSDPSTVLQHTMHRKQH